MAKKKKKKDRKKKKKNHQTITVPILGGLFGLPMQLHQKIIDQMIAKDEARTATKH